MRASSQTAWVCHLSRGGDSGDSSGRLSLLLALALGSNDDRFVDVGNGLLRLGLDISRGLGGSLLRLGGLLLGLLGLGALALDSSTELGESASLGLTGGGRGIALAEEGQRRLALLLYISLGPDRGGGLDGVSDNHLLSERGGGVNRRDDGSSLGSALSLLVGSLSLSSLRLSSLLLFLGEDTAKEAVALVGSGLDSLGSRLLGSLNGGNGLLGGSNLGVGLSGLDGGNSLDGGDHLRRGLLGLDVLLGQGVLLAEAEEGSALAAGRATLRLLSLGLLLSSLKVLLGSVLSLGGVGSLLSDNGLGSLGLLLRSGLQRLKSVLVSLRLGDGEGDLLGLGDFGLDLGNPVVTLGDISGLEGVLVALGSEVELVAVDLGLRSVGLLPLVSVAVCTEC